MARPQGVDSPQAVSKPAANFVDGRIYKDVEEMRQINAAAAKGYMLVCDRCKNMSEPIAAVIAVGESDEAFGFCGDCYRQVSSDFLGHVV